MVKKAVMANNRSRDPEKYVVRWAEVKNYLVEKDASFKAFTQEQLRCKYKYLTKVHRSIKKGKE